MAVITKGTTFANGDQVTAGSLNNLVDNAAFASGAVDNVSTQLSGGAIIVKDGGVSTAKLPDSAVTTAKINDSAVTTAKLADSNVTTAKIADSNVTTAKIADSNVTKAKIENVANMKVLGNTSGSAAAPQEVSILDEDDMSSDSATALATQQSIKAYVDNNLLIPPFGRLKIKLMLTDFALPSGFKNNGALIDLNDSPSGNSYSLYAMTDIPEGYKATAVTVYGDDVNFGVYEGSSAASQSVTSLGAGFDTTGSGSSVSINVTGTSTNYLSIGVSYRLGNGFLYGADVTIAAV